MNTEDMLALTCGQDHNNKISTDMLQGSQVTIITIYITIANEHKYSIFFTNHNIFTIFLYSTWSGDINKAHLKIICK